MKFFLMPQFPSVGEGKISSPLQGSGWPNNYIDVRQINRRKSSLILYIRGIYIKIEIPKMVRQDEAYTA